jgi:acetoin utilization deacetylase AcuC-like enzyme
MGRRWTFAFKTGNMPLMSLPIVYHPDYVSPLPPGHRFPMEKFGGVYRALLADGIASLDQFHLPTPADPDALGLAHDPDYVDAFRHGTLDAKALRRIGLPWSERLVNRSATAVGGTILTTQLALAHGLACNTAGGTHHAYRAFGSGFCIYNDMAIAANWLLNRKLVERVLIVDLDVHQGDGTAAIFHANPSVATFSMHCGANFPFRKQVSDLDVELPIGLEDDAYLSTLAAHLPDLLTHVRPDLVIYDAGVDAHRDDKLGKLCLTDNGLYRRDRYVIQTCLAQRVPVACVIGGGYADSIPTLARRHTLVHRAATDLYATCISPM